MNTVKTKHGNIEYRREGSGKKTVVIFPGGHMDASVSLGEDYFLDHGYSLIAISRPGYGKTPLTTGTTPDAFADAVAELLDSLGIKRVIVVGISAGGRTAIRLVAKYPQLAEKLILQCATSFAPWPDSLTRHIAPLAFNPRTEKYTWRFIHWLLRKMPNLGLRVLLGSMTTRNSSDVIRGLAPQYKKELLNALGRLESREGFMNDLRPVESSAQDVTVPTLIIHSKYDGSVPIEHARLLHQQISGSRLYESEAESHMIWFSPHYKEITDAMDNFLKDARAR